MKSLVAYLTSGMGSRLRPLASCYAAAQKSGRKLLVYWDNITPNGCLARWDELFQNKLEFISLDEMKQLTDCVLFTEGNGIEGHGAEREFTKFGRDALKVLGERFPKLPRNGFNYSYTQENVVIYEDTYLSAVDMGDTTAFVKSLEPIDKVQALIDYWTINLNLSKNFYGVHARGTDVGMPLSHYTSQMSQILAGNPNANFFLITDDGDYEREIVSLFPGRVTRRPKTIYTTKLDPNKPWNDHNNLCLDTEHVQDTVLDIFLLAKTNIAVYHPFSAISAISRMLS